MYKKLVLAVSLLALSFGGYTQIQIIPKPQSLVIPSGNNSIILDGNSNIVFKNDELINSVIFFNSYLNEFYNVKLRENDASSKAKIILSIKENKNAVKGTYSLTVNKSGILIQGVDATGVFYGIQTLIQLLPTESNASLKVPYVTISDAPRFAYRGMHLDVARHFFPVAFVKKYIDYLALHKMNNFHWHLTDDQGWRIEIKKYPRLTQVGSFRNGTIIGHFPGTGNNKLQYGGFYTQEEVREVVEYAQKRYINVIPEIEMPGHASAAIAAYPELSCFPEESTTFPKGTVWSGPAVGKQVQQTWGVFDDVFAPTETTFKFLQDVIDEVLPLFPSKIIHIGGDECPKENWKRSAYCQQLIKEKGLKDEHGLQSYFIQRMEKYINSKGRTIMGWDEILEGGLAPNAMVMSWRGEEGGIAAAKEKHFAVMTPSSHVYFDHAQVKKTDSVTIGGYTPLKKVYSYEPVPKELTAEEGKYILGAQANLWTEYITNPSKVEYHIFPRISALSEVLWSNKSSREWTDFENRMKTQAKRYQLWKVSNGVLIGED